MLRTKLQQYRNRKGISQRELDKFVNLTQSQLSKIENGSRKVTAEELQKIATALDCTIADLLDEPNQKAAGE